MKELKPRIHENGIDYILVGDYYLPDLKLPEDNRSIGHWGRLHKAYLKMYRPAIYSELVLTCKLHTVLADLNEQAMERCDLITRQMAQAEGVSEQMKAENQMLWVQSMNSIRNRAEEIIKHELKASVRARIREPTDMEKVRKEKQHCMTVLSDYRRLLLEWERTCSPVTPDEEWNPLFVEALHKKDYIDYLLDLLTDTPQIEMKALVAELGEEVRKIERRITELSADSHNRRSPKQLGADTER